MLAVEPFPSGPVPLVARVPVLLHFSQGPEAELKLAGGLTPTEWVTSGRPFSSLGISFPSSDLPGVQERSPLWP